MCQDALLVACSIVYLSWSEPHDEKVAELEESKDEDVQFPSQWVTIVEPVGPLNVAPLGSPGNQVVYLYRSVT